VLLSVRVQGLQVDYSRVVYIQCKYTYSTREVSAMRKNIRNNEHMEQSTVDRMEEVCRSRVVLCQVASARLQVALKMRTQFVG
jgi:hypothetical protein